MGKLASLPADWSVDCMTTIATLKKSEDAHLLRMRLESGGIAAYLVDENVTQMEWDLLTGGVRVQVADEDVAAAREFLASWSLEAEPDAG